MSICLWTNITSLKFGRCCQNHWAKIQGKTSSWWFGMNCPSISTSFNWQLPDLRRATSIWNKDSAISILLWLRLIMRQSLGCLMNKRDWLNSPPSPIATVWSEQWVNSHFWPCGTGIGSRNWISRLEGSKNWQKLMSPLQVICLSTTMGMRRGS